MYLDAEYCCSSQLSNIKNKKVYLTLDPQKKIVNLKFSFIMNCARYAIFTLHCFLSLAAGYEKFCYNSRKG